MDDLGGRFWLKLIGMAILLGIAGILLFTLIGFAWYAWGAIGTLAFFFAVLALFAWLADRRARRTTM